jgi:hypothetical protein
MAGTIKLNFDLYVIHGSFISGPSFVRQEIVQTGVGGPNVGTVTATTSGITLTPGLSTLGIGKITNNDPTNFVKVGAVSSGTQYDLLKLKPGESFPVRFMPGVSIGVKADTANCKVTFEIYED